MTINRRKALGLIGLGAAGPAAAQMPKPLTVTFQHGVASGDPLQDRVILWTRITPEAPGKTIPYTWKLVPVGGPKSSAKGGSGVTGPDRDYTVKVDAVGLEAGRSYVYSFTAGGVTSPAGRTRTLPKGATKDVVMAVVSCALYPNGYFNAYQAVADLSRVDVVLHLGDYIYEYGGPGTYGMNSAVAGERPHDPPRDIVSLDDYRRRHAQYKSDPQLQAAHARAPWIVVWDDHETANDSYTDGAQNHRASTQGDWNVRKAAGLKAYFEWQPIREPKPGVSLVDAGMRAFTFGDLASLIMVETRLASRDKQLSLTRDLTFANGVPDVAAFRAKLNDPARRMMSNKQEAWVGSEAARSVKSGHAWQVIGNQVVMARMLPFSPKALLSAEQYASIPEAARGRLKTAEDTAALGLPTTLDMWNGYPVDRERLYAVLRQASARPIVVSGDSHSFWANDLADDAGRRVAAEFGTTGITSPGAGEIAPGLDYGVPVAQFNKEVLFNDQVSSGYLLLTLTRTEAKADMVAVSTLTSKTFTTRIVKTFKVIPNGAGLSAPVET